MNPLFEKFFSVGHVKVGPTICSIGVDGNWLGSVQIYSTQRDIFLKNKFTCVGIRDFNNTISEELFNALQYLSIDKVKFDYFINSLFIVEWDSIDEPNKPDISTLKKRAYIF
jgi:hypothetical protein